MLVSLFNLLNKENLNYNDGMELFLWMFIGKLVRGSWALVRLDHHKRTVFCLIEALRWIVWITFSLGTSGT